MTRQTHLVTYPRFLWKALGISTDGSWRFYTWMFVLSAVALVGALWAEREGLGADRFEAVLARARTTMRARIDRQMEHAA